METMFTTTASLTPEASSESCMTPSGVILWEPRRLTPHLTMKSRSKIGTWNVQTLYEAGRATQVANEMHQYNIAVLAICESRWNGAGQVTLATGEPGISMNNMHMWKEWHLC